MIRLSWLTLATLIACGAVLGTVGALMLTGWARRAGGYGPRRRLHGPRCYEASVSERVGFSARVR